MRRVLLVGLVAIACSGAFWVQSKNTAAPRGIGAKPGGEVALSHADILRTWGNPASLQDHFARHGHDFGARNADDYALMAYRFQRSATAEGYRAKVDDRRVMRLFDPATGSFGAYNPDGTTKTFFKPGSPAYFERQPGRVIALRNPR